MKRRFVIVFAVASMLVLQGNKNMLNVVSAAEVVKETSKAIISDYGTYTLKCQAGSKFMEVYGEITYNEKYKNNAKIVQNEATRIGIWQEWQVIYRKTLNGVKYFELMNLHSGKALAAPCVLAKSGLQLQQNSYTGDDLQLWEIRSVGITGYFNIINKKNGLAITNLKGSSSNNSAIVQEVPGAGEKQNWLFTSINADAYRDDVVVGFFERNDPSQGSVAFDQGNSIPLTWGKNNGKVLWVTQDAWDGKSLQPNNMFCCDDFFKYNNSMFVQQTKTDWSPTCPNIIIDSPMGRPRQICSNQPGTDWSWAGPGIEIGNKVYIHCGEGKGLGATEQSLYVLTQSEDSLWKSERTTPKGLSGQTAVIYAAGMVKASDNYVYCFGSHGNGFQEDINVARFPVKNPQSWTFWDGSKWTEMPSTNKAASISSSLAVSYVAYCNGKYVMVTIDNGFMCSDKRNMYISTSTSPTGPFSERVLVYKIQEYFYGKYARYYTPCIHPESINGRDELLVTYSLNFSGCGVESCQNGYLDPYFYRVKGIRVPYSKIGL